MLLTIIWQYSNKTTNKIMVTCIYNLFHFLIWNIFILLYYHHPEWVEEHLLSKSAIQNESIDDVFWLGFLYLPRVPSKELYGHIKSGLLLLVRKDLRYNNIYKEYYKTISSIFFLLWKDKYIPDQEMKEIIYTSHHDFISSFIRILL
jgi:hypothetical protein